MNAFDFVFLFILTALALVFLCCFLWLLLSPILKLGRWFGSSSRIRSAAERLKTIDRLIEENKYQEALKALRKTIIVDSGGSLAVIEALKEHHQNVLSRCLVIAEDLGSLPDNIAEVERLLLERAELQVLLLKAAESYSSVKSRREKSGKAFPLWSKSEYENRLSQIREELNRNTENLGKALNHLFTSVASSRKEGIMYH